MHPARHPRGRRALVHAALVGLLALVVFALAQCTMVEDQLTNVDMSRRRNSDCVRACKDAFHEALRAETRLHKENLRACGVRGGGDDHDDDGDDEDGDDDGHDDDAADNARIAELMRGGHDRDDDSDKVEHRGNGARKECIRIESQRHRAAIRLIVKAHKQCVRGCHHQGGGSAG